MNSSNFIEMNSTIAYERQDDRSKGQKPRMFKIILLALLCTVVVFVFRAESSPETKSSDANALHPAESNYSLDDVNNVLDKQLQGWNNGNIDQFMEGYIKDSSVRFITNKRVKTSWQEITDSYKKGYPNKEAMGKLSFHRDEVRWINQSAGISQVIGRWEVIQKHQVSENNDDRATDTLSGRFSLIFIGTSEGPKIQIDHTW